MIDVDSNARAIFYEALDRASPEALSAYLEEACGQDPELRGRVDDLLRAHREAGNFLGGEPSVDDTIEHSPITEGFGTVIGPYKLLQQIGEGGFGVVFLAEQERPVHRRVALKVIKPGMDTRQVIARFEAERQALAMMEHPNIAKVFDAGTTAAGRPYFVMELVHGVPMTTYCDEARLTADERLVLFQSVCSAVQHAHQKGIIHRDLKPSNVLVTLHDDKPVPKVIDFGVAKATQSRLTERTLFTEFRQMIGTPSYMSPEQAKMSGLDIDTRSDIYSLGVLLYELLTGTTPIDSKQVSNASYDDLRRLICEAEPPSPSQRLSSLSAEQLTTLAHQRHCEPIQLAVRLRSDLDWIVMKCLEKDRTRRYESASALSQDLQRYLDGMPVEACPPSTIYLVRKYARRNRGLLLAVGLVAASLVVGTVASTWQAFRASRAEANSLKREYDARQSETQTEAVLNFVQDKIFAAARPEGEEGGLGPDVTIRQAVEAALPFVEASFSDQPLIEARLRHTLGVSFYYLGDAHKAVEQFERVRSSFSKYLGPDHPDTLQSMSDLANSYAALGRNAEALKLCEETYELRKKTLGPDHADTLRTMNNLASSYSSLGRYGEAVKLCKETLSIQKAKLGADDPDTLLTMCNLSKCYAALGRRAEALTLSKETLELQKPKLGADHPDTLLTMCNLASAYADLGQYSDALKLRADALALQKVKLGADHPDTLRSMNGLALYYAALGRHVDSLKLREEAMALQEAKLGSDHPITLDSMSSMACYLATCTDPEVRDPTRAVALAKRTSELNPLGNWTLFTSAVVLLHVGREEDYRQLCHRYLELALKNHEFHVADMAAKASLLLPVDGDDFERACKLADIAATSAGVAETAELMPMTSWVHLVKALSDYRQERYQAAIDHTQNIVNSSDAIPECKAAAWYIQASACSRSHEIESAQIAIHNGDQAVANASRSKSEGIWPDWAIVDILRREAVALNGELTSTKAP